MRKATSEPTKEQGTKTVVQDKPTAEQLIYDNGVLVENLMRSREWCEVVYPVLCERILSVTGRYSNGRWQHGSLTRMDKLNLEFQQGYAKGLMDFSNDINDFIVAKKNLEKKMEAERKAAQEPMVGPLDGEE